MIFAFSLLILPATVASYFVDPSSDSIGSRIAETLANFLGPASTGYWVLVFIMVMAFTFFYALVMFNQQNIADNLQKNGGFVPGIRPGESTALYIENISTKYEAEFEYEED